jgi:hypothetical protein
MPKLTKVLFGLSLLLYAISYPTCQWGERVVQSEMAKYPEDFVAAHYFDMIFFKWALPGIMLFFSAGLFLFVGVIVWVVERSRRRRNVKPS